MSTRKLTTDQKHQRKLFAQWVIDMVRQAGRGRNLEEDAEHIVNVITNGVIRPIERMAERPKPWRDS